MTKIGPLTLGPMIGGGVQSLIYKAQGTLTNATPNRPLVAKVFGKLNFVNIKAVNAELRLVKLKHRNIIELLDMFEDETKFAFTFYEYDFTLNQVKSMVIAIHSKPKDVETSTIMKMVYSALAYLHEKNIAHGDLHGNNVLLNNNGEVRLCDFGFSVDAMSHKGKFQNTINMDLIQAVILCIEFATCKTVANFMNKKEVLELIIDSDTIFKSYFEECNIYNGCNPAETILQHTFFLKAKGEEHMGEYLKSLSASQYYTINKLLLSE